MNFYNQLNGEKSQAEYNIIRQEYGNKPLVLNNVAYKEMEEGYYETAYHILKCYETEHMSDDTSLLATCAFFLGNYEEAYINFNKTNVTSPNLNFMTQYITQSLFDSMPRITSNSECQNKELKNGFYPEQMVVDETFDELIKKNSSDVDLYSYESLLKICNSLDKEQMEKNAFSIAEKSFISGNHFTAMVCYHIAAECNPNKALYRGFQAQTRLRMMNTMDTDDERFITNLIDGYVLADTAIILDSTNPRWYFIKLNIMISLSKVAVRYSKSQMYDLVDTIEDLITDQDDIIESLSIIQKAISAL